VEVSDGIVDDELRSKVPGASIVVGPELRGEAGEATSPACAVGAERLATGEPFPLGRSDPVCGDCCGGPLGEVQRCGEV